MLNDNRKTLPNDNPFDKRRLAEEARRDSENIRKAQIQRDKSTLSLQVGNRKQELERLKLDLRNRETKLNGLRNNIALFKRGILELETEINRGESEILSLKSKATSQVRNVGVPKADLDKVRRKVESAKNERQREELELNREEIQSSAVAKRIADLERELSMARSEFERLKRDITDKERDLATEESEIERLEAEYRSEEAENSRKIMPDKTVGNLFLTKNKDLERLKSDLIAKERQRDNSEMEDKTLVGEVDRLRSAIADKEREINALNTKISQIR
ncbi:MAG: hypothetical protein WC631_02720 [Candidatus Paceibacterota bacterium]|jgi:chromosome segregation ATPase